MPRVVLVTGASRTLASRFARLIDADPAVERVLGVDVGPPREDLGRAEFVRADLRSAAIAQLLAREHVDTVVHMNVAATPGTPGDRSTTKETNVIGTMQLLAACQSSPHIRKLVVKSSAAVYGSSPRDPAMFTEETEPRELPRSGFAKDSVDVEGYVRGLLRRRPDVTVTVLRFANFIGPGLRTPLTQYFSMPVLPAPFGFDARLQFVHEVDGLEALRLATTEERPGIYNVAGDGVLTLSQAARRAGRPVVRVARSLVPWAVQAFRYAGFPPLPPDQVEFFTHGRGLDCTRMRTELGLQPEYTTAEAFDDFVHSAASELPPGLLGPERVQAAEVALRSLVVARDDVDHWGCR